MYVIMYLLGHPYDGKASDMWAIGVMLYTMVFGQFPFYDETPKELFGKICSADFYIPRLVLCNKNGRATTLLNKQIVIL